MSMLPAPSTGFFHNVLEGIHDMGNYTMWFPEERRADLARMAPISMWDLHYGIYCAIAITLVRYFIVNPFFVWLGTRTMHLSKRSLREVNARKSGSDHIPSFIFPKFASYLETQNAAKAKAKKSNKPELIVATKIEADKKWNQLEKDLLAQLAQNHPENKYTSSDIRRWLTAFQQDEKRAAKLQKFCESGWTFTFYTFIWVFGMICISDKPYFTESVHLVWDNYPFSPPSLDVTWYYWLSVGHYIHLFVSQFFETKRKDFVEMLIHHVVTLLLLCFSWMVNFSRIGALVLAVHDICDVFLHAAKLLNYMKYGEAANVMFTAFAVCFFVCRLIIFPFRIIYSSLVWTVTTGGYKPWFVYYFFNALLLSLLVLHIFWFSIIARMALAFVLTGTVKQDARSDTDESASDNETTSTNSSSSRQAGGKGKST